MRITITALCLLLTGITLSAQNIELPTAYVRNEVYGNNGLPNQVSGSPYVKEEFLPGTITANGESYQAMLRYNGYQDYFEVQNPDGSKKTILRRPSIRITIGNDHYEVRDYVKENSIRKGYFKIIEDGRNQLLLRQKIQFKDAVVATSSYERDEIASLKPDFQYYLKKGDQPAVKVRLNKKEFINHFEKKSKIKSFIKNNNLRLKKESEVVELLRYLNVEQNS